MPRPSLQIEASEFSLQDMEDMSSRAAAGLRRAGLTDFSTGADIRSGKIEIELSDSDLERVRKTAEDVLASLDLTLRARAEASVVRGRVLADTHSYGGGKLTRWSTHKCSSAFVVERTSDGVDGVLTADHCVPANINKYEETNGSRCNIYYQGSSLGSLGDAAWYTTTHTEYDDFYYSHWSRRDVTGLKEHLWMDVGDVVCRYGRTTGSGSGCKAIKQLFVSGGGYGSLIRTHPTGDQGGDSGGPWYVSGTAWGIHKGHFASNNDSVFTAVSVVDGNMGVQLRTS